MRKSTLTSVLFIALSFCAYSQDWQLPLENFITAKMPMHLVYPQPDNVTQSHSRHRWAHSNMLYQIPIGVQGGVWPFKYEILSGPVAATIGEIYGTVDYGNISWQPTSSGVFTFIVEITDQENNSITAQWDVEVDDSMFVFIQDGYTGNQLGTILEPLEDIEDWYLNDRNDATYHNKIIVFRDGNYLVKGAAATNNNIRLDANSKTPSLIAYPNETPIWDCSQSKIFTDVGSLKDVFVAGIQFKDGRQDVNNAHFFWAIGDVSRATWWKNTFKNLGPGQVGNDNTTPVFVSNTSVTKSYFLIRENVYDQINTVGSNGSYFDIYHSQYILIEDNSAKNSNTNYGWWVKRQNSFVSIRNNKATENVQGSQLTIGYSGITVPHDNEVCYNFIKANEGNNNPSFLWAGSNQHQGATYNSYMYRNSFIGGRTWVRFRGAEDYRVDGNLVISDLLSPNGWDTSIMTETISNITGGTSAGIVDNNGLLTGTYRTDFLGKKGHEIYGMGTLGIDNVGDNANKFKVYPNPFTDEISISLGENYHNISAKIYGVDGKLIQRNSFKNTNKISLKLNAKAGIYFITVISKDKTAVFKVVKK